MSSRLIRITALVLGLVVAGPAQADSIAVLYSSRSDFEDALRESITDTYENPGYDPVGDEQSDAAMSSVLGETRYTTTGFPNHNIVHPFAGFDHAYCAGCNGSFTLDFTETSVGTPAGVFGVGFDIRFNGVPNLPLYTAFVTFGNNMTQDFSLPFVGAPFEGAGSCDGVVG